MERYISIVHESGDRRMERMLDKFHDGLIRIGIDHVKTGHMLSDMELARHHGVPAPLLDFSWSPYIALFFAFNRVRKNENSVLYVLNINQLGKQWAKENSIDPNDPSLSKSYNEFTDPNDDLLKSELPEDTLRILPYPSENSPRMHHQMGVFLYNTLDYEKRSVKDLEEYFEQQEEGFDSCSLPNKTTPTMKKILIPHNLIKDVLSHLELMNINGATLMRNADGVADNIRNDYNYNRKFFLRSSD